MPTQAVEPAVSSQLYDLGHIIIRSALAMVKHDKGVYRGALNFGYFREWADVISRDRRTDILSQKDGHRGT